MCGGMDEEKRKDWGDDRIELKVPWKDKSGQSSYEEDLSKISP